MRPSEIDMERRREMRGGEGEGERGEKRGTGGARGDGPIENFILSETARCRASGEEVVGVGLRR